MHKISTSRIAARLALMALASTSLCAGTIAAAQDASLRANAGEITLNSGFTPDPYIVDVVAGGTIDASRTANGCNGMISRAPDFQVTYRAGSFPLTFQTQADSDTTLVINGADGRWYCDDDGGDGVNAQVMFSNPQSGVYDVWVGTYSGGTARARLFVTELTGGSGGGGGGGGGYGLDMALTANYGEIELRSGFRNDPYVVNVVAGGNIDASEAVDSACRGNVSRAPDFQLTYTAGRLPLVFRTRSNSDTTLVINGADGRWYCDDDTAGNLNAQVFFSNPQSGTYDVWVGTFGGGTAAADLIITELP